VALDNCRNFLRVIRESMKDKETERDARHFITEAHKRGNVAVKKVVDFTKQQLGYMQQKCASPRKLN
jgi:hypothetical protein